jgi:NAD(P)-dependent dehydrogenase (short-subunit alcohol dehydrogenase family)
MVRDLEGKTVLVTGGGRGIGRAIAVRLGAAGALVAVNYAENHTAADETVGKIEAAGGQAFKVQARIGDPGAIDALVASIDAEFTRRIGRPRLDILINNIGGGDYFTIETISEQEFDWTFANNVRGPFMLTKALYHRINDNGRVINVSSIASRLADPGFIAYCMAKAAVEMFTRALAKELGPRGITVNSVAPGFTAGETNAHVSEDPEMLKGVIDATLLRRFGEPAEIADFVHALASPAGRWITAQNIDASGGFKL